MGYKIVILTGVWKRLSPPFMDDFLGLKTSVDEIITDVGKSSTRTKIRGGARRCN
jgi:hypothetical protein